MQNSGRKRVFKKITKKKPITRLSKKPVDEEKIVLKMSLSRAKNGDYHLQAQKFNEMATVLFFIFLKLLQLLDYSSIT